MNRNQDGDASLVRRVTGSKGVESPHAVSHLHLLLVGIACSPESNETVIGRISFHRQRGRGVAIVQGILHVQSQKINAPTQKLLVKEI